MGVFVICVYKPRRGKGAALRRVLQKHLRVLWREGLAAKRKPYLMRAANGAYIEVFEWRSEKAIERAHGNPAILAMWREFEACCTYESLSTLKESRQMFASFEPMKN